MTPRQPAYGKVPNPTSLLTSTDEERFYARSVEWRGVHFHFCINDHAPTLVNARNTEHKTKEKEHFNYGKKTVYFRIRHRGSSR